MPHSCFTRAWSRVFTTVHDAKMSGAMSDEETVLVLDSSSPVASSAGSLPYRRLMLPYTALVSVPILWGTFTPSLKMLLDTRHAPPVILTNLVSHFIGTAALGLLWALEALQRRQCIPVPDSDADCAKAPRRAAMASCELGVYLFFGQLLQLIGLTGTSATTNAILVQSSVVVVPLLEGMESCDAPLGRHFFRVLPSLLALGGIAMITIVPHLLEARGAHAPPDHDQDTAFGIACSIGAAMSYAMHTVRLSAYGEVNATVQATGQVATNAFLDLVALLACIIFEVGGNSTRWLRHANANAIHRLFTAAAWNGVMIVGATTWAMSYAQRSIRASTAALAYAMEPLFACIFSAIVLKDSIGFVQIAGGALIVSANVIAGIRQTAT